MYTQDLIFYPLNKYLLYTIIYRVILYTPNIGNQDKIMFKLLINVMRTCNGI